jgi:cation diffusion facilitator family transporter
MNKFKAINHASIWGMIGNIFLLIIKATIGFITNSQSMIADSFNSASDIFASIMTFIGNKIASIPSDEDHNLGHGKAEYIYSLLISIAMGLMAVSVCKNSILALISQSNYTFNIWLIIVCVITIIIKLILYIYTNRLSKKYNNLLLEANAKDHRNDYLLTSLNLIACLLSLKKIYFVDSLVGIVISIFIFISAIKIFIQSYDVLMDKSLDDETKEKVFDIIKQHTEIKKVIHFNSTPIGYQYQISFTIYVDGNLSTFESHDIANKLEKEIDAKMPEIYLTVIHVNPIEIDNLQKKLKKKTFKKIKS